MKTTNQPIFFESAAEFRCWLEENHKTASEVLVGYYKVKSGKKSMNWSESVDQAICFGWIDGKLKSLDKDRFILRYSPRKPNSVWSKINKDKAEQLIDQGRMTASGLAKIEEAKKNGTWDAAYTNKIRDEIPSDLKKALMENTKAWNNFESFANSYRNTYIGWIIGAKTDDTRKRRISEVVERSILNKKPGIE